MKPQLMLILPLKMKTTTALLSLFLTFALTSCNNSNSSKTEIKNKNQQQVTAPEGMVWVEKKTFTQGAKPEDPFALPREKPAHQVTVDGFFIDATEVTNKQFKAFIDATGYKTVAERPIIWEDMKKDLPPGTPKPHDSVLQPGSLIFNKDLNKVGNMGDYSQWWTWKVGANWKHPEGPESNIDGKDNFPVVHIAFEDAMAYCEWANRRLPTEAEWESAAQGNSTNNTFTWGNDPSILNQYANTWQGVFPIKNESKDGYEFIAPVKSYPPNNIGIYDMAGNVWELTSDLFNVNYYKELDTSKPIVNPQGAAKSFSPNNLYQEERIIKGGSFLCHASYCASFRISAKMGNSIDSSSDHTGFRTVVTPDMLSN